MAQKIITKGGTLVWKGDDFAKDVEEEMLRRANRVGALVSSQVKTNISESNRGNGPSGPGEYPRANTGRLRNSIFFVVKKKVGKEGGFVIIIGTPLLYGLWLEIGTKGGRIIVPVRAKVLHWVGRDGRHRFARRVTQGAIEPRKYLSRTLRETRSRWLAILTAKMPPKRPSNGGE